VSISHLDGPSASGCWKIAYHAWDPFLFRSLQSTGDVLEHCIHFFWIRTTLYLIIDVTDKFSHEFGSSVGDANELEYCCDDWESRITLRELGVIRGQQPHLLIRGAIKHSPSLPILDVRDLDGIDLVLWLLTINIRLCSLQRLTALIRMMIDDN